jgi:hypothetical protein
MPQLEMDSAHTPDGAAFLISSLDEGEGRGIRAFESTSAELLWQIFDPARFFSAADSDTKRVLAVDNRERNLFRLYRASEPEWTLELGDAGNVRNVALSPNGEFGAASSAHLLVSVPSNDPEARKEHDFGEEWTINSVAVNNFGVVVVGVQQAEVFENEVANGRLVVFDPTLEIILDESTLHERSNAWIPTVQFDSAGEFFSMRTLEQINFYQLIRQESEPGGGSG